MLTYTLANGLEIPAIGFGMWQNTNDEEVKSSLKHAIDAGYRLIDGAAAYQNEEAIGEALKELPISREELFLTSKLRNAAHGYENVKREVAESLNKLQTDYLDLYLIHWPVVKGHGDNWQKDNLGTWRAMEELYEEGILKAIGVSNFSVEHLENLVNHARIKPMVNQLLIHPGVTQTETRNYCKKHTILLQAYSPLKPLSVIMEDAKMKRMKEKYQKSVAQILLRFSIDLGIIPLTKSVHEERIKGNIDVFDFKLEEEDMDDLLAWSHPDFTEPDNKNERPPQVS